MTLDIKQWAIAAFTLCTLAACTGIPSGVEAVPSVDPERYVGSWYEIVRLDHSFERGLNRVTADYSKNADGSIKVVNRGFNPEKNAWQSAEGKALFIDPLNRNNTRTGRLKVSFFGPFYSSYNIIELDTEQYQYAMICGPNKSYFWILARTPQLDKAVLDRLLGKAKALGFATEALIYVKH